jgi:hypothetical protein
VKAGLWVVVVVGLLLTLAGMVLGKPFGQDALNSGFAACLLSIIYELQERDKKKRP